MFGDLARQDRRTGTYQGRHQVRRASASVAGLKACLAACCHRSQVVPGYTPNNSHANSNLERWCCLLQCLVATKKGGGREGGWEGYTKASKGLERNGQWLPSQGSLPRRARTIGDAGNGRTLPGPERTN